MSQPFWISVVTPSFNQGSFLRECIESVITQDYPYIEYIIIDGGSTDDSVDIIQDYQEQITHWCSKPDGGQFEAIQTGFSRSKGEVMCWINADDKYHPGAFKTVAEVFQKKPEIEWITGRPTAYNEKGEITHIFDTLPRWSRENYLTGAYHKCCIQQESTFWRRSLWQKAGNHMNTGLQYAGDFELWVRFFRYAQLYTVDALLGGFRYHDQQKTASGLDSYFAEADNLAVNEIKQTGQGIFPDLLPAPALITTTNSK